MSDVIIETVYRVTVGDAEIVLDKEEAQDVSDGLAKAIAGAASAVSRDVVEVDEDDYYNGASLADIWRRKQKKGGT